MVPEKFKTQEMCDKAFEEDPFNIEYVPEKFHNAGGV